MAPFNQRQIGYIQAIAGRQQHTTLVCVNGQSNISSNKPTDVLLQSPALHQTYIYGTNNPNGSGTSASHDLAKSLLIHNWHLDDSELCHDSRTAHNDDRLTTDDLSNLSAVYYGLGNSTSLNAFVSPCKGSLVLQNPSGSDYHVGGDSVAGGSIAVNPNRVKSIHRATTDGFLNSTNVRFRFTLPRDVRATVGGDVHSSTDAHNPMGQDHYEFRWIVWRNKRPTFRNNAAGADVQNLDLIRQGASFRNAGYDFFKGQTGRKRGLLGYTYHADLDKEAMPDDTPSEKYSGARLANGSSGSWENNAIAGDRTSVMWPTGEDAFTVDDIMTMPINKDDYVVMKDVRFFLGKEHGKSHFEDSLHWDWNDPIDTPEDNVLSSPTLNDKNYRWHMTLFGTSGGKSPCTLNTSWRVTTKMESG